jgi:hypothetical protein
MGMRRDAYRTLMGRQEDTAWKTMRVGEDNIKTDLKDINWEGVDWIHLVSG